MKCVWTCWIDACVHKVMKLLQSSSGGCSCPWSCCWILMRHRWLLVPFNSIYSRSLDNVCLNLPLQPTLSLSASQTACLPSFCVFFIRLVIPPQTHSHASFGLSLCLSLCQEWEESAAEAAGRWADVPGCTAWGATCATHASHLAFYCVRGSTITFAFTHAHLFCTAEGPACGLGVNNDSHECVNTLRGRERPAADTQTWSVPHTEKRVSPRFLSFPN